jgi:hypothetical protein
MDSSGRFGAGISERQMTSHGRTETDVLGRAGRGGFLIRSCHSRTAGIGRLSGRA